jgi:glycosyltransferase involved in cell wall biosynthesis
MRIVVDLQACQSIPHRARGIGRYSTALIKAMLRNAGDDEIWVALNGEMPETVEPVRGALAGAIPDERIVVWKALHATGLQQPENCWRHAASVLVREAFLAELQPDVLHVTSLFEGYVDDVVCSVGSGDDFVTAITLYDLIPLVCSDIYLTDPGKRAWYFRKLEELKRADVLLGISDHTCSVAAELATIPVDRLVNISAAADPMFKPLKVESADLEVLLARLSIRRRFLLYPGGFDPRKNMETIVRAYGELSAQLRTTCQLVIVCQTSLEAQSSLLNLAADCGLGSDEIVLTGHVSDAELVVLYNACHAMVFPSLHEGFGLPVLEAMSCGTAVLGSNSSSIPEILGCRQALFDPNLPISIAAKMAEVLIDESFVASLRGHSLRRAQGFCWNRTATIALNAMRASHERRLRESAAKPESGKRPATTSRPKLAYISPLPPERSGIADYSSELLPVLSDHYSIDVVSDQEAISDGWIREHLPHRSTAWFDQHAGEYDRVLYHFGNSLPHAPMFPLLERHPGVVVLHDFFLSGITSHLEWTNKLPGYWTRSLYESHGYGALKERDATMDQERILERYPCNLPVLSHADGVIVHSQFSVQLAEAWFGHGTSRGWTTIPLLRVMPPTPDRQAARRRLGIDPGGLLVCSFGVLGSYKCNREILEGWLASSPFAERRGRLVFVGGSHSDDYRQELERTVADHDAVDRVQITGWVPRQTYRDYLAAADLSVQLRRASRGEASAAVMDCFANHLPVIINLHGPMTELPSDAVLAIPDRFHTIELAAAINRLAADTGLRRELADRANAYCRDTLNPRRIAALYRDAIENSAIASPRRKMATLASKIARIDADFVPTSADLCRLAAGIAANQKRTIGTLQLLVDVSELVRRDSRSGIQRVVRSVLSALLVAPLSGYRIEPVYAEPGQRYRYARSFTGRFLGLAEEMPADEPVDVKSGDVFLGLDLALDEIPANAAQLQDMRNRGAAVYFVVYDILPLARADCFPSHAYGLFSRWLEALTKVADGAICISRSVMAELRDYLDALQPQRARPFKLGWFHLGSDIDASLPTAGVSTEEQALLKKLECSGSILMVGTIEPRKAYPQALDAFEQLWAKGSRLVLIIVGKAGWMSEATIGRLRNHGEAGRRLFWLPNASDELLDQLYTGCSGLLMASEGEGFGLPLIEAGRRGLPILCRDLPVFREIAGDEASYFSGHAGEDLAAAIHDWRALDARGAVPGSGGSGWPGWEQSTRQLLDVLLGAWASHWDPGQRFWFPSYDRRLVLQNGRRERDRIVSTGESGVVVKTWPICPVGSYHRVVLLGEWLNDRGCIRVEAGAGDHWHTLAEICPPISGNRSSDKIVNASTVLPRGSAGIECRITTVGGAQLAIKGFGLLPALSSNLESGGYMSE